MINIIIILFWMNNIVIIKPRHNNLNLFLMRYIIINVLYVDILWTFFSLKKVISEVMVGYDGGRTTTSCIFPEKETGVGGGILELDNCHNHKKQILLSYTKNRGERQRRTQRRRPLSV